MRLVNMAFDMMQQVQGRKYGKGNQIEMKIGIFKLIMLFIAHNKPEFSLIDDSVYQISRGDSAGDTGAITLSKQAYKYAIHGIKYYQRKKNEAKGLQRIDTNQVYKTKPLGYQISKAFLLLQNRTKFVVKDYKEVKDKQYQKKINSYHNYQLG